MKLLILSMLEEQLGASGDGKRAERQRTVAGRIQHSHPREDFAMSGAIQFETPENVRVAYQPAGLGTRFVAYFVDQIILMVLVVVAFVFLIVAGFSVGKVLDDLVDRSKDPEKIAGYAIGLIYLVIGFSNLVYFTLTELFMRGQTLGKRALKIRVVKADGFALDPASILLRNVFRLLDGIPLMWVIPVMSKRSQRTGDMVGGTIVISDQAPDLTGIRAQLSERKAVEAEFRFDSRSLGRLTPQDFEAIERLLDRWSDLKPMQRDELALKLTKALAAKMQTDSPTNERQKRFLEDLLAAEVRRQSRLLG